MHNMIMDSSKNHPNNLYNYKIYTIFRNLAFFHDQWIKCSVFTVEKTWLNIIIFWDM